ncbi:GNAT family N-acetyltransferase [Erythrobacter sp. R86502]|uniref:GNAT family N-acetyltransferase n=1 Tax=Erythrobacter sp. R86502 TaxID=3093846 RepID=UPI0036D41B0B
MYESRIAADRLTVDAVKGFPPEIDTLAAHNLAGHGFLRAAWYAACPSDRATTLLLRRDADGDVLAAIPTVPFGPAMAGARKVPGSYWPLRSPLLSPDCDIFALARAFDCPAARRLGPVWRVGPLRADNPATMRLIAAAQLANWTVLSRKAGTGWVIDLDAARGAPFPGGSAAKKLRAAWRKLEQRGHPHWRRISGDRWDARTLGDMGRIESQSWIGRATDGSGAKFLTEEQRALWHRVLKDPVLATNLSATILMVDDRPVAFTFDLDDGPVQYSIAGGYTEDMKSLGVGKLANYRMMADAIADGQRLLDMGVGDSGYKREMGAAPAYDMADLLFVRRRAAAMMLAPVWGAALPTSCPTAAMEWGARTNG